MSIQFQESLIEALGDAGAEIASVQCEIKATPNSAQLDLVFGVKTDAMNTRDVLLRRRWLADAAGAARRVSGSLYRNGFISLVRMRKGISATGSGIVNVRCEITIRARKENRED